MKIQVVTDVLAANDRIADENRKLFAANRVRFSSAIRSLAARTSVTTCIFMSTTLLVSIYPYR